MASCNIENEVKVKPCAFNTSLCIICQKKLNDDKFGCSVLKPTDSGLQTLFDIARERQDHVFHQLQSICDNMAVKVYVSFHIKCRSRYTAKSSATKRKALSEDPMSDTDEVTSSKQRLSRLDTEGFQINAHCFICGKAHLSSKAHRHQELTPISTGTGSSTREKVLNAAEARKDDIVRLRMISHPDLFASDSKYHRTCYANYITAKSLSAAQKCNDGNQTLTAYDNSLSVLCEEITKKVIVDEEVTTLQLVNQRFQEILVGNNVQGGETQKSWKLKDRLLKSFKENLSFISRRGMSDLVCSSNITVGKALLNAQHVPNDQTYEENVDIDGPTSSANDDSTILHMAAGILRRSMESIEAKTTVFSAPQDLEPNKCLEFVPKCLYNFILWLQDEKAFDNATVIESGLPKEIDMKVLAKCHEIISAAKNMQTPMTLSLALKIHHDTGRRNLIDILNKLGHCVSYDEVRRFLSSAAMQEMKKDPPIPYGLSEVVSTQKNQIDAAIDNFDRNEQTIDGKSTTHAMAMVIYQRSTSPSEPLSIERLAKKAITEAEVMDYEEDVKIFAKPTVRPEPPVVTDQQVFAVSQDDLASFILDLLWVLMRYLSKSGHRPPDWSNFNALLSTVYPTPAVVRYLPFIHASPTDVSTIYTALLTLVKISDHLGQDHILVTADLAIYKVAQEILWSKPPLLDGKVTMRLGAMHLMMAFIASIGTLYGDGGLLPLLVDSGVYAHASANLMLQGKQLARAIRGLRLAFEAMLNLQLKALLSWTENEDESLLPSNIDSLMEGFQRALQNEDKEEILRLAKPLQTEINDIKSKLDEFNKVGRSMSSTFTYWANFIEAVGVLLRLLRADRDADFDLHLKTVLESIPWMNAGGRNNYAKFTPVYVAEMRNLENDKPQSYQHMKEGGFVVRRSSDHQFNAVATDQALEQTINNECKSQGGVVGFTLRKGVLTRWLLTRHISSQYATAFSNLSDSSTFNPRGIGQTELQREQEDVSKMIQLVENQWQNPFLLETTPSQLINISSGRVAPEQIEQSLVHAFENGTDTMNLFCRERLISSSKSLSFWKPVKSTKVLTFSETNKSVKKDSSISIDSEVMFRRLLAVAQQRDVLLENVLKFELAAVPPSLFTPDGMMRKTQKAELAKKLESVTSKAHGEPHAEKTTAYVVDGMAMLHALPERSFKTFNDLGELVLKNMMKVLGGGFCVTTVVLIFDRYDNPMSVKCQERSNRYGDLATASHVISGVRNVPPYQRFLGTQGNRESLALFVSEYIMNYHMRILHGKEIILAGGFKDGATVIRLTPNVVEEMPELFSSQEEADTRVILHTIHQAQTKERVIIRCDDTDVLVLLVYYSSIGAIDAESYMHAGHSGPTTNNTRFISINAIVMALGKVTCGCLPAVHCLTGCDSTSSMFHVGKRTAFSTLQKNLGTVQKLQEFGISENFEEVLPVARKYVVSLFGNHRKSNGGKCETLDELRYVLATTTDKSASQLPPTEDAFRQHALRCHYQTKVWTSSHICNPELPSPIQYGWQVENGKMMPVPCENEPGPIEVRDYTHLFCSDKTCTGPGKCQCRSAEMNCIELCKCKGDCSNQRKAVLLNDEDGD